MSELNIKQWLNAIKERLSSLMARPSTDNTVAENDNQQAKAKQQRWALVAGGVLLAILVISFFYAPGDSSTPTESHQKEKKPATQIVSPLKNFDAESVWVEKAQGTLSQQAALTQHLTAKTSSALKQQQLLQQQNQAQQKTINQLTVQVAALQESFEQLKQRTQSPKGAERLIAPDGKTSLTARVSGTPSTVQRYVVNLTPRTGPTPKPLPKTPEHYVPLGSHVKAVLIGGVDVSAAVTASSAPRVVYMRTQGNVRLPGKEKTPLKNCYILGSSWGDISSERAYIRLVSMSCDYQDRLVEYSVKGNVFGPDGRLGIRGKVVMRDGALVGRAFVGGLFSGLGDTYSDNYTNTSTSPLGTVNSVQEGAALQYGMGQGMKKAADMYADYNIKRAEQYQPVIEVSAGTVSDVVFAKGFYLNGYEDGIKTSTQPKTEVRSVQPSIQPLSPMMKAAIKAQANPQQRVMSGTQPSSPMTTFP